MSDDCAASSSRPRKGLDILGDLDEGDEFEVGVGVGVVESR